MSVRYGMLNVWCWVCNVEYVVGYVCWMCDDECVLLNVCCWVCGVECLLLGILLSAWC